MKLVPIVIALVFSFSISHAQNSPHASKTPPEKLDIKIDPAEGGITIAKLFASKNDYTNKTVKIRGKVTKFNSNIMGKNWIHIQDGTSHSGENDLTITSDIAVKVNDIITIEGKITLDKDFGYGYYYNVIMEEGKLIE